MGIYRGLKMLELACDIAGALAGRACADRGAEVIKVEPEDGDALRHRQSHGPGESKLFLALNRGKKSIVISPTRGRDLLESMLREMDVVIVSATDRGNPFHIGYEDARRINPRIIYVEASAFGKSGPWAGKFANDLVMQAFAGTMMTEGKKRADGVTPAAIKSTRFADFGTGLMLCIAISAALFHRARTGEGQAVETSLLQNLLLLQGARVADNPRADTAVNKAREPMLEARAAGASLRTFQRPLPAVVNAFYRAYQTRDGAVFVGALTRGLRDKARAALETDLLTRDAPGWDANDPVQFDEAMEKQRDIERRVKQKTTAEWISIFEQAGVPTGEVIFPEDLADIRHLHDNRYLVETGDGTLQVAPHIRYGCRPDYTPGPSPAPGQHTEEILGRYGGTR